MITAMDTTTLIVAFAVSFLAGLVKGVVGFALPLVLVSGLSTVLPPQVALAAIVVPAVVTNVWQALRQGIGAAAGSFGKFRVLICLALAVLVVVAQGVALMADRVLLVALGAPIVLISMIQLAGWRPDFSARRERADLYAGATVGVFGGLAGMFGAPMTLYLTAIGTEKTEQIRVQGVTFGLAAVAFGAAHLISGIVTGATFVFSIALTLPALLGLAAGFRIQDRVNQKTFRTLTLVVLLLAGLNLFRKAAFL